MTNTEREAVGTKRQKEVRDRRESEKRRRSRARKTGKEMMP